LLSEVGDRMGHRVAARGMPERRVLRSLILPVCQNCCGPCRQERFDAIVELVVAEALAKEAKHAG
jgi:hypothetical protein